VPSTPTLERPETAAAPAGGADPVCPYVGPSPFLSSDAYRFFGRGQEAVELKHRVMAHPITVMYAMSGAGKTSLINARLVPDFLREGCQVLPSARVRGSNWKLTPAEIGNIYVFHAVMGWQDQCDPMIAAGLKDRALKDELAPRAKLAEEADSLLIAVFDQFEELFTAYSSRWSDRRGFFRQLSEALESLSNLRVLLAMREDYLASLDPYASTVPEHFRTRFRLERLRREAALEAIVKPLKGTGRSFAPGVADKLLDSLMTIHVRPQSDASGLGSDNEDTDLLSTAAVGQSSDEMRAITSSDLEDYSTTSEYVEPVQLQVVCQNLWYNLGPDEVEITAAHLQSRGDVTEALARFYEACVKEASETADVREGVIRRWFREQLITPSGTRGLVLRRRDKTGELPNEAVDVLEGRHIIRGEDRGGARWYELSHDRFIEPIVSSNRRWEAMRPTQAIWANLKQRAASWESAPAEQKVSFLLNAAELAKADEWKKSTESDELGISDQVRRFFAESRADIEKTRFEEERRAAEAEKLAEREKSRRLRGIAVGLVATLVVVLGLLGYAEHNRRKAQRSELNAKTEAQNARDSERTAELERTKALVNQSAMQAAIEMQKPTDALSHIQQAIHLAETKMERRIEKHSKGVIRNTLSQINHRNKLGPYRDEVNEAVFAPSTWDPTPRKDFHPIVAVGGRDGQVDVWDLGDYNDPRDDRLLIPSIRPILPGTASKGLWISRIVFHPAGRRALAFATGDPASTDPADRGGAWVWTAPDSADAPGCLLSLETGTASGPVADVAFSPDGMTVATAGRQKLDPAGDPSVDGAWVGFVHLFDSSTGTLLDKFSMNGPAQSVAFDRHGRRLVAASGDRNGTYPDLPGQVVVYELKTRTKTVMKNCDHPSIRALFSPDGSVVVSGGIDGIGRVHEPAAGRLIATLVGHVQLITALDFSRDGTRLVTASGDRTARIWNPDSWLGSRNAESAAVWSSTVKLVGHTSWLTGAEFSQDGTLVLTCGYDRTSRVWDAETGECLVTQIGHDGAVNSARLRSRGYLMATAGSDNAARVWTTGHVETARLVLASRSATARDGAGAEKSPPAPGGPGPASQSPAGHEAALRDVELSPRPGSNLALTAGADGVASLWDVSHYDKPGFAALVRRFATEPPGASLTDVAFSPDGDQFATAGLDGEVRVWEVEGDEKAKPRVIRAGAGANGRAALGVTFSPRGTYLLTSWADGQMRLYRRDWSDGKPVRVWPGSAWRLTPQLFDPAERFVVTPNAGLLRIEGKSGAVSVWEVASAQQPTWTQIVKAGPVTDLAVHPSSHAIAAATAGPLGSVLAWDEEGRPIGEPIRHPAGVERLAFRPDGKALATEGEYGQGRLWDWPLRDGETPRILTGLTGPSPVLIFSDDSSHLISDGGYLATDGAATIGQIWDPSGTTAIPLKGPRDRVVTLAFARVGDDSEVLSINHANRLQRWSLNGEDKGDPRGTCRGPNLKPTAAAIRPGGDLAASGTKSGTLKLWWTDKGDEIAELKAHKRRINSLQFSGDGRRLVSTSDDGLACVWSVPDREALDGESRRLRPAVLDPLARFHHDQKVTAARFLDPQGQRVVTGTGDLQRGQWQPEAEMYQKAFAYRIDLTDPQAPPRPVIAMEELIPRSFPDGAPTGVVTAAVSPSDGRVFLGCGGLDSTSNMVWSQEPSTGKSGVQTYLGHTDPVLDVVVSPDGQRLATASVDNTARVWTVGKSEAVELRGHNGDVASVKFSPDGLYVLTVSRQDGTARVWDRDGGDPLYVLGTHRAGFNSATLSDPPGPRQYTDDVVAATFSPDGKLVVTASGDGTARAYRMALCGDFEDLKGVAKLRLDGFLDRLPGDR
jgi:WD40 repeat protein